MPRAARRKATKPKPIPWRALLWAAVLANIGAGLLWSRATAAQRIRVVGAIPDEEGRIRTLLQSLRGVPCVQSSHRRIESLVQAGESVDTAAFTQNLFGRGILRVQPRVPVAVIAVSRPVALSRDGDLYSAELTINVPRIRLNGLARATNFSLAAAWEPGAVANLAKKLVNILPNSGWTVEVDGVGVLSLSRGSGARIVLGSVDDMEEKLKRLQKALAETPGLLERVSRIDLTSPRAPVFIPRP